MSYQEERLQEIADAIREVKGTTEKIPATNFASEIVGLSVVKPSGIKTITENGDYDVTDYAWASVNVEADLNERVIIGKWGADVNFDESWVFEFLIDKTFKLNAGTTIITGSYVISGTQIIMSVDSETMTVQYNNENDTIDISGDILFRMPTVSATLITKEVTENGTYKASDDGADGYSEVVVNVAGSGDEEIVVPPPFASATVTDIKRVGNEISAKGLTSDKVSSLYGWKIGDTKDITLTTGEVIQMRIIGFNHDTLSDGSGTAGITLEMVDCLNTKYSLRSDYTNAGGWKDTKLRTETLPTIKATLPQEWQSIIKLVDKKSANGGGANFTEVVTTSDDLFLLSQVELANEIGYAQSIEEGAVYEYWNGKTNGSRLKKVGSSYNGWWLRSCGNQPSYFIYATNTGDLQTSWGNSSYGISFAFCVGSRKDIPSVGDPIELSTDTEMTNALVEDNLGKVYKFTGTSDTYETDAIYIVSEV